jgi:hypothetical protein
MRRLFALFLTSAILSACGELPHPFIHDEDAAPALAMPAAMQPVVVAPVPDHPGLAEAMVNALGQQDIPASLADGGDRFLHLSAIAGNGRVLWTIAGKDGKPIGESLQTLSGPLEDSALAASEKLASALRGEDFGGADLAARPRVIVDDVIATGGMLDAGLLKRSLILALQQKGIAVSTDKAKLHIKGGVRISPGVGGKDLVEVTWIVADDQGIEIGKVNQGNMVPHDQLISLATRMTHQIADGGAEGVAQLVHTKPNPR